MVIVEKQMKWAGDGQLDEPLRITSAYSIKGKYGPEIELTVADQFDIEYRTGCYGANLNFMVYHFGNDTDKWVGQHIKIVKEERDWKGGTKTLKIFQRI